MKNPEISVIMGMYNCADTLSEAIESSFKPDNERNGS